MVPLPFPSNAPGVEERAGGGGGLKKSEHVLLSSECYGLQPQSRRNIGQTGQQAEERSKV